MSTPQNPRDPGERPEDNDSEQAGRTEPTSDAPRPGDTGRDEPFTAPSAPQPPDETRTADHAPPPPSQPAATAPQPPEPTGPPDTGSHDPPTEYLPKLLGRESRTGYESRGGAGGTPGAVPGQDREAAAYEQGWWPPGSGPAEGAQSGAYPPGGEVPPQAWSAEPEEQTPGQAWQPQSPGGRQVSGQAGFPSPGGYGDQRDRTGGGAEQSGWGPPGVQPGRGEPDARAGWGEPGGRPGWGGPGAHPGWGPPEAQPGWGESGGHPGRAEYGEKSGWGAAPGEQPGWGTAPGDQSGWGGAPSGQQGWPGGAPGPGGYPAYPQQQYQPYGATPPPERTGPQVLSIIGFACAAISLFFCPLLFGPAGIVLGIVGHVRGEPLGKWAAVASGVCLVVGLVVGLLITNTDMIPTETFR